MTSCDFCALPIGKDAGLAFQEKDAVLLITTTFRYCDSDCHAHANGEPCDDEKCQDCCDEFVGHERDPDEGMICLNCDAEWEG